MKYDFSVIQGNGNFYQAVNQFIVYHGTFAFVAHSQKGKCRVMLVHYLKSAISWRCNSEHKQMTDIGQVALTASRMTR